MASTPPPSEPGAPPSEPSSTSPSSQKSDDCEGDGGEAGPLQLLLASLGLGQFVPALVELGADEPADIGLVSEEELRELGMKPIQARKLLRAVQPPAPAPPATAPAPAPAPPAAEEAAAVEPAARAAGGETRKAKAPSKRKAEQSDNSTKASTKPKASVPKGSATKKKKKKKKKGKIAADVELEPEPEEETGQLVGDEFTLAGFPGERYNGLYWLDEKTTPAYNMCPHYVSATGMHLYYQEERWVLAEELPAATVARRAAVSQFDHQAEILPLGTNPWMVMDAAAGAGQVHRVQLKRAHTQLGSDTAAVFAKWQQPGSGGAEPAKGALRLKQAIAKAGILQGDSAEIQIPSSVEVAEMAAYLGVDLEVEHVALRGLVVEYLSAPLPAGWEEWYDATHGVMFYSSTWPAICTWHHPYEDYYRQLLRKLGYLSSEAAALRASNQRLLAEQMQSRYNLLRTEHQAALDGWLKDETASQRDVRAMRYTTFFREEMDRREGAAATAVGAPILVFQGTSKQLATWRKLGDRAPDAPRRDRMVEATSVHAGEIHKWKGLAQGTFLSRIADQTRLRCDAATMIQKVARSMRPRRLLLQAQARSIQAELEDNARLNAVAVKVMKRILMLGLSQCLLMWADWTATMLRCKALVRKFAATQQDLCFQAWVDLREDGIRDREQMDRASKMVTRMMHQAFVQCFEKWSGWVAKVLAARDMAAKLQGDVKRQCFEDWLDDVQRLKEDKDRHQQAEIFVVRMKMQTVTKCLLQWGDWAGQMAQVKSLLRSHLLGTQQQCFDAWVCLLEERIREDGQLADAAKMVARLLKQGQTRCLEAWSEWTAKVRAARQMGRRLQSGYMRVCLYEWMEHVHRRRVKAAKLRVAEKFATESIYGTAQASLQQWSDWLRKMKASRALLQKMRGKFLAEVLFFWHDWSMDRGEWAVEFERRAIRMRRKRVVQVSRQCWLAWRQRAYVRWLSRDYCNYLQRRRRKEELQAWFLWARACRRADTGFRHRQRNRLRGMLQYWRRWAVQKFAARTEVNRKLRREVEKAQSAAVIAAHHLERRMGATAAAGSAESVPGLHHEHGSGTHRSGSTSARQHLDGVQGQVAVLGDLSEDVDYVLQLQKRAELCQSHLEKARRGQVKPKAALATLHSLTGSPPKRQSQAPKLPPVSAADRWRPTPRGGRDKAGGGSSKAVSAKYLVTDADADSHAAEQTYTVLGKKALVRIGADPESTIIEELPGGTVVHGLEEKLQGGHSRIRVGEDRWVSRVTAKGKVLLEELSPQK
jgi:hypothetical protein